MNKINLQNTDDRLFGKILKQQAEQNGQQAFLINDTQTITFKQAEVQTNQIAAGLLALGLSKGQRIGLFMGNLPEMVLLALAINKIGAIWTPINTDYKGDWLLETIDKGELSLLITDAEHQQRLSDIQNRCNVNKFVLIGDTTATKLQDAIAYEALFSHGELQTDYADQHYGDTCAILWTSGTTGKSKGVLQSYNAWIRAIIKGASLQYDSKPGDKIYCVLPLFNSAAWITSVLRALIEGIPCIIEQKFSVSHFWQRVAEFGATQTFAIGAMGVFLMNAPESSSDANTTLTTAQIVPMPPTIWEAFEKRFDLTLLRTGLGMSECLVVCNQVNVVDDVPVYALGFSLDDTEVALFDDEGNPVPDGQVGEICIREKEPHCLFSGYFKNEEATKAAFRGEWFLTGDLGLNDPKHGAFMYADRKKDAVRFAGRNISTLEVESIFRRHPAVQDVAAFGIASTEVEAEQELKVDLILQSTVSHEELCEFVNNNAPHYFVPRYMEFVDVLPYTPTNKLQKFKLRDKGVTENTWDLKQSSYKVVR